MNADHQIPEAETKRNARLWVFVLLVIALLLVVGLNLSLGSVRIPLKDIVSAILGSNDV
jgi:ABC-type Fe3+-siderophore transport system permease subunit